ncbi:MAG: hypothetical protein A3K19_32775 [Lentisphaerae bacterium RIFOXYB12_FULL_65_16]|nr:MAG: hypothetical protein A3K18_28130 [Lentisphaerae bacterium RIFOXYA12_64_32]OGV84518.1 MAG: hypothetical protein A3K19_32775 [Lentisphaerae bacterium RIFOXYB12_FULL_65_16]
MPTRKLVSFDWAMKRLLRSKANFAVLEGFLSELLRDDITITEILESESNADSGDGKVTRVDMKVRDHLGRQIIIELQHTRQGDYLQRMLYYASRAVTETLPRGQAYAKVERVISVNIVYFDVGQGNDYVYLGRNEFRGIHTQDTLTLSPEQRTAFGCDDVAELFPEYYILRVNKFDDVARDGLDQWVYFLKNEDIPGNFDAKGLREAKDTLDVMKLSETERHAYEAYQDDLHLQASLYEESYGKLTETMQKLEEAQRREEDERRQKEAIMAAAVKALVAKGVSETEARKLLGG